jgi:hypothetical protein
MGVLNSRIVSVLAGSLQAGSATIRQTIENIFELQNKKILWGVDDRQFKSVGTSGVNYDKALITIATMPSVSVASQINTNFVASGVPNTIYENNLMYASNLIPFEVPTPVENNGLRMLYEISSITSGWNVQHNTVQVISDIRFV